MRVAIRNSFMPCLKAIQILRPIEKHLHSFTQNLSVRSNILVKLTGAQSTAGIVCYLNHILLE